MKLNINGEARELGRVMTVAELLEAEGVRSSPGVAVAVNDTVVPRREWPNTTLNTGDTVEIVHAVQGG